MLRRRAGWETVTAILLLAIGTIPATITLTFRIPSGAGAVIGAGGRLNLLIAWLAFGLTLILTTVCSGRRRCPIKKAHGYE